MSAQPPAANVVEAAASLWSQAGQLHWLPVTGNSMAPWLRPGDEVLVQHGGHNFRRGDVLVLRQANGLLVHRLLRAVPWLVPEQLWTQGDNNREPDAVNHASAVLGRVVAMRRGHRQAGLNGARWRLTGWLIATSLLALQRLGEPGPLAWPRRKAASAGRRLLAGVRYVICR